MESNKDSWIITPELYRSIKRFQFRLELSKGEPIMIVGPTGVGKTLFLRIAEYIYKKKLNIRNSKIGWVNCAHFGGINSDPNLARSELFGHVKGAFTGANKDKAGLVKMYEGGVLILEEIGELPLGVQAMLLTFIETGEYRSVGGIRNEIVNKIPTIVGATNREKVLRKDFRYRFYSFYVPPLYERREDILYYWAYKFPTILNSMKGWEILTLLAYNWPGNVREIERIGKFIEVDNLYQIKMMKLNKRNEKDQKKYGWINNSQLIKVLNQRGHSHTLLNPIKMPELHAHLSAFSDVDIKRLDEILDIFGLSVNVKIDIYPFSDLNNTKLKYNLGVEELLRLINDEQFKEYERLKDIDFAYVGFLLFNALFNQDEQKNKNLLTVYLGSSRKIDPENQPRIIKDIFDDNKELEESVKKFAVRVKEVRRRSNITGMLNNKFNIFTMTRDELLKLYYKTLLEINEGKASAVAIIADRPDGTVGSELKRLGLKKEPTKPPQ